ncbi:unnamed protein product [Adineta ricciae]|uniref:PDZ domain-containing protein n=1 Tax=Adineta ricciae TaxID=249248 RepID=A0A816EPV5_ADIRI|nr:unnamed protein product [Adineta ricciae]
MTTTPIIKVVDLYRHELLNDSFGVEWMDDNDENNPTNAKYSVISIRSVFNNHNVHLPTHIWRSLSKVLPGDIVVELNGVSTAGQTVAELEKNLKLSGNRIRIRLKSGMTSFICELPLGNDSHVEAKNRTGLKA